MYEQERPFDYNRSPSFTPTKPDLARGTLTRKVLMSVQTKCFRDRHHYSKPELVRLSRINNYLHRREQRMRDAV